MGIKSHHFHRSELACKCGCGFDAVDVELLYVLEDLRKHFGSPLVITSGNRCMAHNTRVGGSPNSQHLNGIAADIRIVGVQPEVVANYLEEKYPKKYGIGRYDRWVHVDVRKYKARWG